MNIQELLSQRYFGNSVEDYLWFIGSVLAALILMRFLSHWISSILYFFVRKNASSTTAKDLEAKIAPPLRWIIMLSVLFIGTSHIEFPVEWDLEPIENLGLRMVLSRTFNFAYLLSFLWLILRFIDYIGLRMLRKAEQTESKYDDQIIPFLKEVVKVIVAILGLFFILDNVFEIDVTTLVAGLGIGGVAIALASKESLENLLGSFTIFLDKPFTIGDVVTVAGYTGTVERVGFRSTRLRTFEKSYVTIPNKKMVDAELDNLTLRTFRRARFFVGLTYDTHPDTMRAIIADIQKLLDDNEKTNMDGQVRFDGFGPSSLDLLVYYFVDTLEYEEYLKVKEHINFSIMDIVHKHGADFAFPSTTVYLHHEEKENKK